MVLQYKYEEGQAFTHSIGLFVLICEWKKLAETYANTAPSKVKLSMTACTKEVYFTILVLWICCSVLKSASICSKCILVANKT